MSTRVALHRAPCRPAAARPPAARPAPVRGASRLLRGWAAAPALAGPVCTTLAGRRLSWWRLSAGVTASQLLFHWLYSATAVAAATPALSCLDGRHGAHAGPTGSPVSGIGSSAGTSLGEVPGAGGALHADSPAMAAAHLLPSLRLRGPPEGPQLALAA